MASRTTIREIAQACGKSKSTVALALRGSRKIADETREMICDLAASMGYQVDPVVANLMAHLSRSKSESHQGSLALLNLDPREDALDIYPTQSEWRRGIQDRAKERGYTIDQMWLMEPGMSGCRVAQIIKSRGIAGVFIAANSQGISIMHEFPEIWSQNSCVVLGKRTYKPPLNFTSNDQFATSLLAYQKLQKMGYKRIGIAIPDHLDETLDNRFVAGYFAACIKFQGDKTIPVCHYPYSKRVFMAWYLEHQPEVIICNHNDVMTWLQEEGYDIPGDVGLIHLDRAANQDEWAGTDQNSHLIGSISVDMLIGQIHRDEIGIPECVSCMMVPSFWCDGPSIRKPVVAQSISAI